MRRDLEWLNQNASRAYPLREDVTSRASAHPAGGPSTLPQDLLVDLKFMAPLSTDFPYRVGAVSYTGALLSVLIQDAADRPLAGSTINIRTAKPFQDLELASLYEGVTGVVTFGPGVKTVQDTWVPGKYVFDEDGAATESSVAIPYQSAQVTSIFDMKEEANPLAVLVGDVKWIAGNNVRILRDAATNTWVLRLLDTSAFIPECEKGCQRGVCAAGAITRLAGVTPEPFTGRIKLKGENGVTLNISNGKIILGHTLKPADLCANDDRAPEGSLGGIGPQGIDGRDGLCLCDQCDVGCTLIQSATLAPNPLTGGGP
jgi:hypothetical protein